MLTFKSEWVIQAVEMKERQVCVNECPFFKLKANRYDLLGLQTDRQTDRLSSMSIRITQCVLGKHIFWLRFQNPMESLHVYKCVKSNLNSFISLLVLVRNSLFRFILPSFLNCLQLQVDPFTGMPSQISLTNRI